MRFNSLDFIFAHSFVRQKVGLGTGFDIQQGVLVQDYSSKSSIARITFGEFGGVVDANHSTSLPSRSIRCLWKFQRGDFITPCSATHW